jgi:MEMO1 family protein
MDFPKLRYVEAFPVSSQDEKVVCLRDPTNMTDKVIFLPAAALFIVSLFDGTHSIRDIQAAYMRQFGQLLYSEKIREIINQLDASLFLESENYFRHKLQLEEEFLASPTRPPAHAGISYPCSADELKVTLDRHFQEAQGEGSVNAVFPKKAPKALIAPHIDLRVGGLCYAWAYEQIRAADYDVFVILGTAHAATKNLFVATSKDYETPLGTVKTNRSLLQKLDQKCRNKLFEDQFVHKQEHSIEFQTVYLRYLFNDKEEFEVLPILCSSFHRFLQERNSPLENEEFQRFIDGLQEILGDSGLRTCVIAAADLAHIGLRFGDPTAPDDFGLQRLKQEDESKLSHLTRLNRQAFWESIERENDRHRICGFPCIYTMLTVLEAHAGHLLKYGQMNDRNTGSAVSYASMVFY